jgi:CRP-like cAMP-binding protein
LAQKTPTYTNNLLLKALPEADLSLLAPSLVFEELPVKRVVELPNVPIRRVIFPTSGIVSVVADVDERSSAEVGLIGNEGVTGMPIALGSDRSPHKVYMQLAGSGWVVQAPAFRAALDKSKSLSTVVLRFAQAFMVQIAHTAVSNANARLEQRLARWLLMARDRCESDDITLTHEFISLMLAVRRPGVTVALKALETRGMVKVGRGVIRLLNRKAVETLAGPYYGGAESELKRLMR